jgi:hypothetical protein
LLLKNEDLRLQAEGLKRTAEAAMAGMSKAEYENLQLTAKIAELAAQLAKANKENEALRVKAGEPAANPGNSGTPPSKGFGRIARKPKHGTEGEPEKKEKGRPGAKPGHDPHFREPFGKDEIDHFEEFEPSSTTCACGCQMERHAEGDVVAQQI